MKYWGKMSKYLHWAGAIDETIEDWSWVESGITIIKKACMYIWNNQINRETGVMMPKDMHPEILNLWERYRDEKIGIDEVKISSRLLEPVIN